MTVTSTRLYRVLASVHFYFSSVDLLEIMEIITATAPLPAVAVFSY